MKTIETFEGIRAQMYDQSIRIWCPDYDFIHALLPSVLNFHLGNEVEKNILIVGSGTGTEIINLLQLKSSWNITGVDPSAEMMNQAKEKLNASFPDSNFKLVTGTVHDLPRSQSWDAAVSILVLQFLPDDGSKLQLLQDIAQRLTKGAKLIFVDIYGEGESFMYNLELLRAFISAKVLESTTIEKGVQHIAQDLFPISSKRLRSLLKEAGFGETHMFTKSLIFGGWITTKLT